uniref:adenylate kinase isoenzyme 1 isoform X1 n=2 Tax=Osmia lignaria TaxID=473952 RepID=UPI0014790647|nr:adenylate kinase isoenzyme 1 isoform X1 [Osmia lignaria]
MSTIPPFLLFTSFITIIIEEGRGKIENNCRINFEQDFVSSTSNRLKNLEKMKTVWIIGGPGCGKGTQCERIIAKYGFYHISSGDLLREEVASGSPRGASLQELMSKGLFVPTDIVLDLIRERMQKAKCEGATKTGFLIDGYPRELDQGILFEKNVCPVDLIIFFDVANETLMKRLLGRAAVSKRADDNEETIKKRIEIFNIKNGEIVEHYKDKVVRINAEGSVDAIFLEASKALDGLLA